MHNLPHSQSLIRILQKSLLGGVQMKASHTDIEVTFFRSHAINKSGICRKESLHIHQSCFTSGKIFIKATVTYPLLFPGQPAKINSSSSISSSKADSQPVNNGSIRQNN